jgi:D-alanyl-D-alanine dipeptidase
MPIFPASFARWAVASIAALATLATAQAANSGLPTGFVYLRDVAPTIRQDIRYAGMHNFIGRPIDGYEAPECVLTVQAAQALARVQNALARGGLALIVWDCYRPARAVADFLRWTRDADSRMKIEFYPETEKRELVALGYIAARSTHSRGSTVDLGLVPASLAAPPIWEPRWALVPCTAAKDDRAEDGTVDLGTGFDCFDPRAHFTFADIGAAARANRTLLRDAMVRQGFVPYDREWWHFRLAQEPHPNRVFDFPIPPHGKAR